MQHTLLVIGAAIERAAKATAAKNVDFMLMDLSDEAEKRGLMLLYVFKQEETVERIGNAFFTREKKNQHPPHSSFMQKPPPACSEVTNADFLASFRWHVRVLPLCSLALAMHTIAVTSEGIAMGRRKYGSIASVPFRHKSVSQQPMRA